MIPIVLDWLDFQGPLHVMRYITVRGATGLVLSFALSLIFGPMVIRALRRLKMGQPILTIKHREGALDLSEMHGSKAGTPTMGGLLIIATFLIPALLLCDWREPRFWILVLMTVGFGLIGGLDDYLKITQQHSRGLRPRYKMLGQLGLGLLLGVILMLLPNDQQPTYLIRATDTQAAQMISAWPSDAEIIEPDEQVKDQDEEFSVVVRSHSHLLIPLFKNLYPSLGWFFILWVAFVTIASSNAVNLTDGLDGLAIGVTTMVTICFTVIAYIVARVGLARYLLIPFVPGAEEISVFLGCVIGSAFGFLWFNSHPAEVFMGDVGSLTLGGLIGAVAVMLRTELLLVVVGGIFVVEAASVIIQVGSYKLTGKRVFRMAPIHHHFEKLGWHESKIIARFWIIGALLALFGLAALKLR